MRFKSTRRRFMELAGVGTTVSLAGCESLQNLGADEESTDVQTDTGGGATAKVTVSIEPDQQRLQQRQQEIESAFQSGNITRSQAQQRFQSAQIELLSDAVDQFREQASADLTVEDTVTQAGVLLVSGPAIRLIDALALDSVNSLLDKSDFEQIQSQVSTPTGTATESEIPTETATESETPQN